MGDQTLSLKRAWSIYDRWLEDPRVEFHPETGSAETALRELTEPFASKPASKWVGDCWLLACASTSHASLVTFDKALYEFARKRGCVAVIPA